MAGEKSPGVQIFTRRWCLYCVAARRLFKKLCVGFEEIKLDGRPELRREVSEKAGGWPTVPMIFIGPRFIGGYAEAAALHREGALLRLLDAHEPRTDMDGVVEPHANPYDSRKP
jgi:glutaredoxin 3